MLVSYALKAVVFIGFISCLLNWGAVSLFSLDLTQSTLLIFLSPKSKDNSSAFPAQSIMLILFEKYFSVNTYC